MNGGREGEATRSFLRTVAAPDSVSLSQKPGPGSPGMQQGPQYLLTECISRLADPWDLGLGAARWGRAGG